MKLLISILFMCVGLANAEVITVTGDYVVVGKIVESTESYITVQTPKEQFRIYRSNIISIKQELDVSALPAPKSVGNSSAPVRTAAAIGPQQNSEWRYSGESLLELNGGWRAANKELKSGLWGEVARMWYMDCVGSMGLAVGYSKSDNKIRSLSKGDVTIWSFLGKVRLHTDPEKQIGYFGEVSGGVYAFVHRLDSDVTDALAASGYSASEDVSPTFGGSVGAGVRYGPPNCNFALGIFRHLMRPESKVTVTNHNTHTTRTSKEHLDLNSTVIQAAFRFQY